MRYKIVLQYLCFVVAWGHAPSPPCASQWQTAVVSMESPQRSALISFSSGLIGLSVAEGLLAAWRPSSGQPSSPARRSGPPSLRHRPSIPTTEGEQASKSPPCGTPASSWKKYQVWVLGLKVWEPLDSLWTLDVNGQVTPWLIRAMTLNLKFGVAFAVAPAAMWNASLMCCFC